MLFGRHSSFGELKTYLAGLSNQVVGAAASVCETGEPYVEFFEVGLARPADVEIIERLVAGRMGVHLQEYLGGRSGRIYWRIPFESEVTEYPIVARYDDNGPDRDVVTDRKCVFDRNWRRVACYCRLYRASLPTFDTAPVSHIAA